MKYKLIALAQTGQETSDWYDLIRLFTWTEQVYSNSAIRRIPVDPRYFDKLKESLFLKKERKRKLRRSRWRKYVQD